MVLSMDRWVGKVAIVTGASAGIGAEIARQLVAEGMQVVGLARRLEPMQELAENLNGGKGKLHPIKADLTVEQDILDAFKWTIDKVGPINVLINNAGLSRPTTLSSGSTEMWRTILETNVLALSIATREAIQNMKLNNVDGQIIHINSILGHYVAHVPNINMYSASKHAVTALTETLRQELLFSGTQIRIGAVSPGPVESEFLVSNNQDKDANFFSALPKLKGSDVADAVVYILSTPQHVQVQDILLRPLGEPV